MAVPGAPNAVSSSSQRRRKGTIASRYLEAIGIQCGAESNVSTSRSAYRSTPIEKTDSGYGSGFDNNYYSFKDSPSMKNSNKNRAIWSQSVYDKINGTAKAADCSKSIITASTALMLDHSDSISTTPTSPGGSGRSGNRSSPSRSGRMPRRGRSPTSIRSGTNSKSNNSRSDKIDDSSNHEYVHLPGTRSTAPLSDGVKSAPTTPNRFNERRKLQFRTRSWGNRTTATPLTTKSIMAINSSNDSDSDSSAGNSSKPDSRLGLAFYKNTNAADEAPSPLYDATASPMHETPITPSQSSHNARRDLFPKTSPRKPSNSPGPQPRSPRSQYTYSQQQQGQDTYSRSLFEQTPKTPDHRKDGSSSHNNLHPQYPTNSEAGSPTEIMENRWHPPTGHDESSQPSSSHYHSDPTDSEAGAPTEITKNHVDLRRPYLLRRPSGGNGGNQILLKDRRSNSSNDILARVRSRFHIQQQQPTNKEQIDKPVKSSMPSLLDSSSSCASSALPIGAAQAEGASASILSPTTPTSRLSRHVENARKQSILSPTASEATSLPASLDNETYGSTSLTTEIGSTSQSHRLGAKSLSSLNKAAAKEAAAPKQGGLLRRPVGARVAALESRYRKGKFTVRGAQPEAAEKQEIVRDEGESEDKGDFPDPILSASYTMDEHLYQQDVEESHMEVEDIKFKDSEEDSEKKSHASPNHEVYEDNDYEESPLPEYIRNQTVGGGEHLSPVFVAYNDRQTPNTDGIFQFKKGRGKIQKNRGGKANASNSKVSNSRGRDRGGKSPIQPLFSSERLDESNTSSIHESSIRSKSLGRTMTSQQFMKIVNKNEEPRRSKSLSERSERNKQHLDQQPEFSMELSEAMKTVAKERERRNQNKQKEQEPPKKSVPGNIVVNNEKSNAYDGADTSRSDSSLTQSSIPSPPSQPTKALGAKRFMPSPGEANTKTTSRSQNVPGKESSTSIKDKIRAFNLKKSPKINNASWKFEMSCDSTNGSRRINEEKKEEQDAKLDRKNLWARYYAESVNNRVEDESNSSSNDDFSVQSLREQLEQKISKIQDVSGGDEEDDDDRSVKSLRDMFEPATKKQTGETINHLKARFEPKPKAPRLSFTKQARLQRQRSKRIEESNQKAEGYGEAFLKNPVRSDLDSEQPENGAKREIEVAAEQKPKSFEWWKLEEKDSTRGNGREDFQAAQMSENSYGRLNDWSSRHQVEKASNHLHSVERNRNSNCSNFNSGPTRTRDAKSRWESTDTGGGNRHVSSQNRVFGLIETRKAPLKDNNRKVPGSHWVSQGSISSGEHQIQKKGTKESSSDSEYSEAVTLDPSFADVSNLSTPSALQSPTEQEDEQNEFEDSSSVLFENLETTSSHELGTSNSELAIPELKESRSQAKNTRVVSGSSIRKYKNLNSQNMAQNRSNAAMGSSSTEMKRESPNVVTPDTGHTSGNRSHFFNREPIDRGLGATAVRSNIHSDSQRAVSPIQGNSHHPAHAPSPGLKALSGSSRPMLASNRVAESNIHPGRTNEFNYQNSETSQPSVENTNRGVDSSNRFNRSSATPLSNRSSRPMDNPYSDHDASNRSRGMQESSHELNEAIAIPHREGELSDRSTRSSGTQRSGTSNFQGNSSLSYRQKPNTLGSVMKDAHGPSWDESRDRNTTHKHNLSVGTSQPSSKPPVVPPMPSPFDENYAAIMESRHKMLMVRQRALLDRRANREKAQKYQQGFFGRTNPGNTDENTSLLNHTYREPRLSDEISDGREPKSPEIRMTIKPPSNPSSGWETPPTHRSSSLNAHGSRRANEAKEAMVPQSPVASMLSRIRPTFSAMTRRDNGTSQRQAVIDRIAAVRAARLRRNYAYGKIIQSSNNYGASESKNSLPSKLETIHSNNIPGYRYYPHNELDDFKTRDEDESLSTFESNPQEFAAEFSLD